MISKVDFILILMLLITTTYTVHIWWSRSHDSVLRSSILTILQILGIMIFMEGTENLVVAYLNGEALEYKDIVIRIGLYCVLSAPIIYLLFIRPLFLEIKEKEKHADGIIDNAADAIVTIDERGIIVSVNKTVHKIFGYSAEDLTGQNIKMIIRNVNGKTENNLGMFLEEGESGGGEKKVEVIGVHNDGSNIPLKLAASEHVYNKRRFFTLIMHDLTDIKTAEEFYKGMFNNSPIGIYIIQSGVFKFVNPQFQKYTGYSEDDLLGKKCYEIVDPEDWHMIRENAVKMLKGERTTPYEYRVMKKSGEKKWILETVASVDFNGERATLGNFIYIEEYKHMEESLNTMNLKLADRVDELEQRNEQIEILNEMSEVVQSCIGIGEACEAITFYAKKLFACDSGAMCLMNESGTIAEMVSEWGKSGINKEAFKVDDCWALRRGVTHVVGSRGSNLRCEHLKDPQQYDYICVPLISQGGTLGVLFICPNPGNLIEVSERRLENRARLAKSLAEYGSLALRNLKLQDKLRQRSIRDPLTGLYNRGYMEETLEREIACSNRSNKPLGVIMIDVDHFKQFNDKYGHEVGDNVLRHVARMLEGHVRGGDIVCRYGGEEFILIMPGINADDARKRAEEIRMDAKNLHMIHSEKFIGIVTLSLGVAISPDNGNSCLELIQSADEALYKAKEEGRDRVILKESNGYREEPLSVKNTENVWR